MTKQNILFIDGPLNGRQSESPTEETNELYIVDPGVGFHVYVRKRDKDNNNAILKDQGRALFVYVPPPPMYMDLPPSPLVYDPPDDDPRLRAFQDVITRAALPPEAIRYATEADSFGPSPPGRGFAPWSIDAVALNILGAGYEEWRRARLAAAFGS